jgi:hypothetical protein
MLQNLPKDAATFFLNPAGPGLAFLIRQAYAQAAQSAQPMPANIAQALSPYFPPNILSSAKFTTRARAGISLATITLEVNGDVAAMTLDNIIVFDDDQRAQDLGTWAHELIHVSQYRNMGVEGFAALYASPVGLQLEDDAYAWSDHVVSAIDQQLTAQRQWLDQSSSSTISHPSWQDFHQAAREFIPPDQCGQWRQVAQNRIVVHNVCRIGLVITAINNGGVELPCDGSNCFFPPDNQHALVGPPGPIFGIRFVFQ